MAAKSLWEPVIADTFDLSAEAILLAGDAAESLKSIPDSTAKLVITSPPYNIGKSYETAVGLTEYLENLTPIISEVMRVLANDGSLCWQVGNYVDHGEIFSLDIFYYPFFKRHGLKLRNRIIWHFDHGLHARPC